MQQKLVSRMYEFHLFVIRVIS